VARRILILDFERGGDQVRIGCRIGELDVAGAVDLGLHQELRALGVDDQAELGCAWLRGVGLSAGVEGLGGEPEFAVLPGTEAETPFFGAPLVVEVPGCSSIPRDENADGRGLLVRC
jgi:hypothetical protein